jgi:simple sugar transport system ATP-binding protein
MRMASDGKVRVGGRALRGGDPRDAIRAGVAHVPEDRLGTGLAPSLSIASNVVLKSYRGRALSRGPLLKLRSIRDRAVELIRRYDVHTPGPLTPVRQLSGGNLQKLVLGREFSGEPRVLVAASPTRGLDVGAIETVHAYLRDAAGRGIAILLLSEDLDEILTLADRIAVMYEGRIVGEVDADEATVEELGLMMAGGSP